jgi:hypothetical protein
MSGNRSSLLSGDGGRLVAMKSCSGGVFQPVVRQLAGLERTVRGRVPAELVRECNFLSRELDFQTSFTRTCWTHQAKHALHRRDIVVFGAEAGALARLYKVISILRTSGKFMR